MKVFELQKQTIERIIENRNYFHMDTNRVMNVITTNEPESLMLSDVSEYSEINQRRIAAHASTVLINMMTFDESYNYKRMQQELSSILAPVAYVGI